MISREALEKFADQAPTPNDSAPSRSGFDMRAFIAQHGFKVLREKPWASHPGGTVFELEQCLFDPNHTQGSASFTYLNGVPGFCCQHNGCRDKTIKDVFAVYTRVQAETDSDSKDQTQAQLLIELAEDVELFHTPDGDSYARYKVGAHFEVNSLRSRSFQLWLRKRFYDLCEKPPSALALKDAIAILAAKAQFEGPEVAVAVRLAEHNGQIYVDLCNRDWEVVEISPEAWRIITDPPVRFRRAKGMLALPRPEPGGSLAALRSLINIGDDQNWILLLGWLVAACRASGPYPVLVLQGEQGSAKSTLERIVRLLLDPSVAPVRTPPGAERDLMIAATNSWVIAYDNLSGIPQWLSDSLCRLATGGGFSNRELYKDSEEVFFNPMRPVILNGIDYLTERPDLADRVIVLNLPRIGEPRRRAEREVYSALEKELPRILGALYSAVSAALAELPGTTLLGLPRMADFALWVAAAAHGLGFSQAEFLRAYQGNRAEAIEETLAGDAVSAAIVTMMERHQENSEASWKGTCKELNSCLEEIAGDAVKKSKGWPQNPRALSGRLRRLITFLRESGIDVIFPPPGTKGPQGRRLLTITRVSSHTTATTATTAAQSNKLLNNESVEDDHPGGGPGVEEQEAYASAPQPPPSPAEASPQKLQQNGAVVAVDCRGQRGDRQCNAEGSPYYCANCRCEVEWMWRDHAWVCPNCRAPGPSRKADGSERETIEL